ncbi:MAG TPA: MAPEG family protein, partial [Candidatus Binatia bacterium]|nr:MAPEG family protein [Candidatus Binatia bacterium]
MLLVGGHNPATWVLWVMGIVTASRYLHAAGMIFSPTLAKPHPLRFVGALGTYLGGLALCIVVFQLM